MKRIMIALLLLGTIVAAGCGQKAESQATPPALDQAANEQVANEVAADIAEIDAIDEELQNDDLDTVEQDLENVDW